MADAAGPGEILISDTIRKRLESDSVELRRKWRFQGKGAPKDLKVYAAKLGG